MNKTRITVGTIVSADIGKVWDFWTKPNHIVNWNFASDDWHCPSAENDLIVGGKFSYRMQAKDGSAGFDFEGLYDEVIEQKRITYSMSDGRQATTIFDDMGSKTKVTTTFDADNVNPVEIQKNGWQAILENFRGYVESG